MKYTLVAIILAVIIVGVVAFFAFESKKDAKTIQPVIKSNNKVQNPDNSAGSGQVKKSAVADLTFPASGSSKEVYTEFNTRVYDMSVEATQIKIKNCVPTPAIIRLKKGAAVTIINEDTVERVLANLPSVKTTKLAGGAQLVVTPVEVGVYGFTCDAAAGRANAVGIIAVMDAK